MEDFEEKWQRIEENFRWDNVYKTMKKLDWDWCIDKSKNLYGIPTIETIKATAKRLLLDVWENKKSVASAGFVATYEEDNHLTLEFVIESIYSGDYL